MGNIQALGKLQAGMLSAAKPYLPKPLLTAMASRSVDWWVMSEDLPDPKNRVTVGADGGVRVHWQPNNRVAHRELIKRAARMMRAAGYPLVFTETLGIETNSHQCGTARFGDDPATSVLDSHCKTHDINNLYIVDSSFFPSSTAMNPALTICAQALRVADHLQGFAASAIGVERMSHTIGIDLGGSKIALGLVTPDSAILARRRIDTEADAGLQSVIERLAEQVDDLTAALPPGEGIAAIGIGAPGPVDHISGDLLTLVNLPGISNTPFRRVLSERLALPVVLDHDAKVAALGEFHFGAGRDRDSMIYIVIGTGVGAAIIYEGALLYGESNSAGESGHMTVDPNGHLCHCGSRGCLETYSSGPALTRLYANLTGESISGGEIARRAQNGDEPARTVFRSAGRALGIAIASLAMTLNIETFVIGGSVANAGDLLLQPARESLKDYSFKAVSARVKVFASELGEDAPILGAAHMARRLTTG